MSDDDRKMVELIEARWEARLGLGAPSYVAYGDVLCLLAMIRKLDAKPEDQTRETLGESMP